MNARGLAERATLGTLLLDPAATPRVMGWLRAGDFADPWHREVYTALREARAADPAAGPERIGGQLADRVGHRRADLPRLIDLLRITPAAPDVHAYASMVVEAALRREIPGYGVLIRAAALAAALEATPAPLHAISATVRAHLDAAGQRWKAATTSDRPMRLATDPRHPGADEPVAMPRRIGVDAPAIAAEKYLAAHPVPSRTDVAAHEADLIAALVSKPARVDAVGAWLRPAALTGARWRPVYAALLDLREQRARIDPVTLAWAAQRVAPLHGDGPGAAAIQAHVEAMRPACPGYLAAVVAGDHLRIAAEHGSAGLYLAAENPGLPLPEVIGAGYVLLDALQTAAAPLADPDLDRDEDPWADVHRLPTLTWNGPVAG